MIDVRDLRKSYVTPAETVEVLKGVSLRVDPGECVALTGVSGSGKSTLLNILAGLQTADAGDAVVAGRNVTGATREQLVTMRLKDVGVIFQDHNLAPDFTALENVEIIARAQGLTGREAKDRSMGALDAVGVAHVAGRRPSHISGGQAQRVGIARALVGGRQVILADEPTGSLDKTTSATTFELFRRLADDGATVVVCSHDPLLMDYATRGYHLDDGLVAHQNTLVA